jgi:hypothetical protein
VSLTYKTFSGLLAHYRMTLKTNIASADWHALAVLGHSKTGVFRVTLSIAVGLFVTSCAHVPGETLASWSLKRQVSERVLAQASSAAPQCRQQKIANTEIVEVHPDGKPALEIWTVEQCGRRSHYRVYFPPTGRGPGFSVQAER